MTQDIVVVAFPVKTGESWARASGLVKARLEHAGQTYQDVLEIGQPLKLEWRVIRADSGALSVTVRNPSRQRIEGALAFITPPETWADNLAPVVLPPREQGFSLNAGEEITLPLPPTGTLGGAWAVVRLSYNGYVAYLRADGRPVAAGHGKL